MKYIIYIQINLLKYNNINSYKDIIIFKSHFPTYEIKVLLEKKINDFYNEFEKDCNTYFNGILSEDNKNELLNKLKDIEEGILFYKKNTNLFNKTIEDKLYKYNRINELILENKCILFYIDDEIELYSLPKCYEDVKTLINEYKKNKVYINNIR